MGPLRFLTTNAFLSVRTVFQPTLQYAVTDPGAVCICHFCMTLFFLIKKRAGYEKVSTGVFRSVHLDVSLYLIFCVLTVIHGQGESRVDAPHGLHFVLPFI